MRVDREDTAAVDLALGVGEALVFVEPHVGFFDLRVEVVLVQEDDIGFDLFQHLVELLLFVQEIEEFEVIVTLFHLECLFLVVRCFRTFNDLFIKLFLHLKCAESHRIVTLSRLVNQVEALLGLTELRQFNQAVCLHQLQPLHQIGLDVGPSLF